MEGLSALDLEKKLSTHLSANALLFLACVLGYDDIITSALEAGASWRQLYDLNAHEWEYIMENKYSPLLYLSYAHSVHNNGWRIEKYIEMGSNINARHTSASTPLLVATCRENFELMEILVSLGASFDDSYHTISPAMGSVVSDDTEGLLKLISLGLDVNQHISFNEFDMSLFEFACFHGARKCVHVLIEAGVTVTAESVLNCLDPNLMDTVHKAYYSQNPPKSRMQRVASAVKRLIWAS